MENILVKGEIARWIKEMMFVAISKDRSCGYCTAAHLACCRMLGVSTGLLDGLVRDVHGIQDIKLRDLILFALKWSRDPQSLAEVDFKQLRDHGLKQSGIVEVIAMPAFAVYANLIADATRMSPEEMFETIGPSA